MNNKNVCKIIISFIIITLLMGSLSSCGKASTNKVVNNEINIENDINFTANDESDDDSQSYFNAFNHNVAKGENGYYFLNATGDHIMYFDEESRTSFPLCGKADCKHNDNTCNAFLGKASYILDTIYYYKGYVYIIAKSGGNAVLERVNADGSGRVELGTICPDNYGVRLVFYGDSVYVFDGAQNVSDTDTDSTRVIRKFSLDKKTEDNIFEYTGTNITLGEGKNYGNKLFFLIKSHTKDEENKLTFNNLGLFAYDYATQETDKVVDANVRDYSIDVKNNIIYYYVYGDGLYKYKMTTKENTKIFEADEETGYCDISYDGRYIYMENNSWKLYQMVAHVKEKVPQKCWVLDSDGSIIKTINCDGIGIFFHGDKNFYFALKRNASSPSGLAYIDKNDIENAKDWISCEDTTKQY